MWPLSSPTGGLGLCSAMAAREFAGAAEDMGATTRAEGSIARADHLKAAYWDANDYSPRGFLGESRPQCFVTAVLGGSTLGGKDSFPQ